MTVGVTAYAHAVYTYMSVPAHCFLSLVICVTLFIDSIYLLPPSSVLSLIKRVEHYTLGPSEAPSPHLYFFPNFVFTGLDKTHKLGT